MNLVSEVGIFSEELNLNVSGNLTELANVFQTQISAILLTAIEILHRIFSNKEIAICSDSQAAIMGMCSSCLSSKIVTECQKLLSKVAEICYLLLSWIPTYIDGNEKMD